MAKTVIRTVCGLPDCMHCGLSAEVDNGVITRIRPGDFPDSADRGVCAKGMATRELIYHPDRLKYPLKRAGERGEDKWQRVSWDEALTAIAARMQEITQRFGPAAVAWMTPTGPNLVGGGYSRLASLTKSTLVDWRGCGDGAGSCADIVTFGYSRADSLLLPDPNPRFVIVWGYNPALTNFDHMRKIIRARRKGAKVVVIDPRFTATAAHADEHIALRPGTDGALALGMINVVLQEGHRDKRFIAENTVGPLLVRRDNGLFLKESEVMPGGRPESLMIMDEYSGRRQVAGTPQAKPAVNGDFSISGVECEPAFQLLCDMVRGYTPEKVAQITDIPADVIRRLAVAYGSHRPASIFRGAGLQRTFYGDLACRAISALAAITGNINLETPPEFILNSAGFLTPGEPGTVLPVMMLYDAAGKSQPYPVRALWCSSRDFMSQMPNTKRVAGDILRHLELLVVCDLFMTPSARHADYVLPLASFYECPDICVADFYHTYLQLQQRVIDPLGESRSDFQIAADLGRKLGLGDSFNKTEEQYIEELLTSRDYTMDGISLKRLKEGPIMARPLDRPLQFQTPTGLIEFYVERLKKAGQELPIYREPVESNRTEGAKTHPLSLLSTHSMPGIHAGPASTLGDKPEPKLEINPSDARSRDIMDGDTVRVFNGRGEVKLKARLSHRMKPGVVDIARWWSTDQYMQGHPGELTHESINPVQQSILGPNAPSNDVLVQVEKAPE